MLEAQVHLISLWYEAGDRLRAARDNAIEERDRGEVTATTALIVLLAIRPLSLSRKQWSSPSVQLTDFTSR